MGNTRIEWTKKTWNPVTGCTKISPGCQNCYAERMAKRLRGRCGYDAENPFKVTLHPDRLEEPLHWRKPSTVFVCSMGDLFHEDVPRWIRFEVMDIILQAKQHIFLILTKRPANMKDFFEWYYTKAGRTTETIKNLWLGITAENQEMADLRIPILLQIPAAVRFVSVEPMLGPVDLTAVMLPDHLQPDWAYGMPYGITFDALQPNESHIYDSENHLDWVICGSESGPNRRPANIVWMLSLKDQCVAAGVPFFLKQMEVGGRLVKMPKLEGKIWNEMPEAQP
jgi:protein gp37